MIWLLVGDEYDLAGKNEATPCRFKDGSMTTLDKAKESGKPFDVWLGYWEDACLAPSVYIKGDITLCFKKDRKSPDFYEREVLQEAVFKRFNDKAFLEEIGLSSISVYLNND